MPSISRSVLLLNASIPRKIGAKGFWGAQLAYIRCEKIQNMQVVPHSSQKVDFRPHHVMNYVKAILWVNNFWQISCSYLFAVMSLNVYPVGQPFKYRCEKKRKRLC